MKHGWFMYVYVVYDIALLTCDILKIADCFTVSPSHEAGSHLD